MEGGCLGCLSFLSPGNDGCVCRYCGVWSFGIGIVVVVAEGGDLFVVAIVVIVEDDNEDGVGRLMVRREGGRTTRGLDDDASAGKRTAGEAPCASSNGAVRGTAARYLFETCEG